MHKAALVKGMIAGSLSMIIYLIIVVITTPALDAIDAINAAVRANTIILALIGLGVGMQFYIKEYSKVLGCRVNINKGNAGSITSGFFSLFALVPLGCCGTMLYILSLLPSIVGVGASAILIEYSKPLAYIALAVMFGFNILAYIRLKKEHRLRIKN